MNEFIVTPVLEFGFELMRIVEKFSSEESPRHVVDFVLI